MTDKTQPDFGPDWGETRTLAPYLGNVPLTDYEELKCLVTSLERRIPKLEKETA